MNKIIISVGVVVALSFLGAFGWWYSAQNSVAVPVVESLSTQKLSLGWPADVVQGPSPKASISDFSIDTNTEPAPELAVNTIKKPSVSAFSVAEIITSVATTTSCVLHTDIQHCCSYPTVISRNECIASTAFYLNKVALCEYITGETAKAACRNAFIKTKIAASVSVNNPATVVNPNTTTNPEVTPTTYITDGSNRYNYLYPTTTPNYPTSTYGGNGTSPNSGTIGDLGVTNPKLYAVTGFNPLTGAPSGYTLSCATQTLLNGSNFSTDPEKPNIFYLRETIKDQVGLKENGKSYVIAAGVSSNGSSLKVKMPTNMEGGIYFAEVFAGGVPEKVDTSMFKAGVRTTVQCLY